MSRKVIKQGNNTLTITLPREWTSKFGIKGGDELNAEEKGRSIIFSSTKEIKTENMELTINDKSKFLRRFINIPYRQGVDEIRINFKDRKVLELIQKDIESLLGFEIVEQGKDYCILKNVAVAMESEFDTIIRRIFLMLKLNFSDLALAVKSGRFDDLAGIIESEKINNKLVNFCQRTINKKGHLENHKITGVFYIVSLLEQIADELRNICRTIIKKNSKVSKETINSVDKANELFIRLYSLYYKFDKDLLIEMSEYELKTVEYCEKIIQEKKDSEVLVLHHVLNIIRIMHHTTEMI